jgi:probable phosphoglycerate mutase
VRHGETEWSRSGRHTGRTDIPLADAGRRQAADLGARLAGHSFQLVLSSPRVRAIDTARLAGYGPSVEIDSDLGEWDYGAFEGLTTPQIRERLPGWTIWAGPWERGETPGDVAARAERVIERCLSSTAEDVLLFGHGHQLRVLAARWIGLAPADGGRFMLTTASVSILGWERSTRAIERWNDAASR